MANEKEIRVPDIGDFDTVDVIEVLVSSGDYVNIEDPLITLESDKATMDIPSPETGIIKDIKIKVGDKIAQGGLILILEPTSGRASSNTASPAESEDAFVVENTLATKQKTLTDIVVPDIGDFDTVDVIGILVSPGDSINVEDPLITLESDKATMDIPAPQAGRVESIKVKIGDKISKGDLILRLLGNDVSISTATFTTSDSNKKIEPQVTNTNQEIKKHTGSHAPHYSDTPINETSFRKAHASPSIRKFARELGVDLSKVNGTGYKNRILKENVQAYVKQALISGTTGSPGLYVAELPRIDFSKFGEIEIQPLTKINKLTGKFLHRSWFYIPHVTQFDEADITDLDQFRKELQEEYKAKGIKITFLAFLLKATVSALKELPRFNSSLDNDQENLIMKKYYHIGIAVDTPAGLIVPVIRNADQKSLVELATEILDIAQRAREKKITPAEMQGACFTISSQGSIGGTSFTPIVNQPEVAILGVSKVSIKPVYMNNEFVPRKILPLSLSYDHRVIDGAAAAKFTTHLAKVLSDPKRLLL